jgi:photosystem II stability/assembly factor-like uncharacterized protein
VAYAAGRTGPFVTEDGGETWTGLANAGLGIPPPRLNEVATLAVDPFDPDHLLATALDVGGIISRNGGGLWERVDGLPQPPVAPLVYRFAAWRQGSVFAAAAPPVCLESLGAELPPADCDAPGSGLYRSNDGGRSWSALPASAVTGRAVVAFLLHPEDPGWMLASTVTGGLLRTTDGGVTWSTAEGFEGRPVRSLALDPSNPSIVLAGLAGGGIWRSEDGGATFSWTGVGVPAESVITSIVIRPEPRRLMFAGDLLSGVYLSLDDGQTWFDYNPGLAHRSVTALSLALGTGELWAGIEGAGIWTLDLAPFDR